MPLTLDPFFPVPFSHLVFLGLEKVDGQCLPSLDCMCLNKETLLHLGGECLVSTETMSERNMLWQVVQDRQW